MKSLLALGIFMFALSFCGITEKLTGTKDFNPVNNSNAEPASKTEASAEKAVLTPDLSAKLDGEPLKWEEQGISWKLPKGWKQISKDRTMLNYASPDNAFLIASISNMADDFPVDASTEAFYTGAVTRMKNGEVKKVQYTEIDGIKGVEFIESSPEDKTGPQRHQWIAYRKYGGQTQMLNIMLSTKGSNFDNHADEFQAIMYSMGIVK
ncbi:MAG: hypothetical protein KIS76_12135 [Pyrinomonadaceae bacterium]|nr:hypothetical protein [Pyrinomonadaceae bacterium]